MGSFGISEGNITGREIQNKKQNACLTSAFSGEVAQMFALATSKQRLDREVQNTFLG